MVDLIDFFCERIKITFSEEIENFLKRKIYRMLKWSLRKIFEKLFLFCFAFFLTKELSFCHKLWFCYLYMIFIYLRYFKLWMFFRSNNDSLKYLRLTLSGWKDIAIWKSEFVAKNSVPFQFTYSSYCAWGKYHILTIRCFSYFSSILRTWKIFYWYLFVNWTLSQIIYINIYQGVIQKLFVFY